MCLAIPSCILEIDGLVALVDSAGEQRKVSLMLMPEEVAVGDYVLIQNGNLAYEKVDAERARESLKLIGEIFAQGVTDVRAW
ncbi:MAG: HypC/HybG/HupF family hydrogenase formation chaperone [Zoogloeaceae bacterium]|jgi:hydrogenase expression/formation protein HypC|nr:HypC/HybG/HupF family hydrogenase formation chaperone [Zoogloeaceae bacterium]